MAGQYLAMLFRMSDVEVDRRTVSERKAEGKTD